MKKEIFLGFLWGLTLGLLIIALLYSTTHSAELYEPTNGNGNGELEISISGDSVRITFEKDGLEKTAIVNADSVVRSPNVLYFQDVLVIEDGMISIDGVELSEAEIERLSVSRDEEYFSPWCEDENGKKQIRRKRLATVRPGRNGDVVGFHDVIIDSASVIHGDVVSLSGKITIRGKVYGDIVSVFGDVDLEDGAYIQGDVAAPFGEIHRAENARVKGEVVNRREFGEEKKHRASLGMSARFNRVEGFTFLPSFRFVDRNGRIPTTEVNLAYAVSLKRWEYDFVVKHRFGKTIGPYFDADMFQQASSQDLWIFSESENSIAGLFFKEDFWDFYWQRGFRGEAGIYHKAGMEAGLSYTAARISNLQRTAEKAIFGGKKEFRENWSTILPDSADLMNSAGNLQEAALTFRYDTRDEKAEPHSGIFAALAIRQTIDSEPVDFEYQMITAEIKGYIPVGRDQTVMLRTNAGYSDDYLPLFKRFFLGGVGSLRGYDYKEFSGNRYMLLNADYIWQFHRCELGAGIFFDAGKAGYDEQFNDNDIKTDVGICLLVSDAIRLDLAQRLDDLDKSPVVFARLQTLF